MPPRFCLFDDKFQRITRDDWLKAFKKYLEENCLQQVEDLLLAMDTTIHYALDLSALDLLQANMVMGSLLLTHPVEVFPCFDEAIVEFQADVMAGHDDQSMMIVKPHVHARVGNLPITPEVVKTSVPRSEDVGQFIQVEGTVIRAGKMRMLVYQREYECVLCHHRFTLTADIEQFNTMVKPSICPSIGDAHPCKSTQFAAVEGSALCRDYQEVKIQEHVQRLRVGTLPRTVNIILHDDLVDAVKAGDEAIVTGVVMRRWKPLQPQQRATVEIVVAANHLTVKNQQKQGNFVGDEMREEFDQFWKEYEDRPLEGRNVILASVCPQVFGLFMVKMALMLCLMGGVQRYDESGMHSRGESHLLLVGDPGTGKSQFLKYAALLANRAVLTTGGGTTTAGLTVTAVKDGGGEWMLEAGALVLADGGVCCIDEFDQIREHDRTAIHEAMEQQTLSVAKAGLVCELRSRTSVIAATNPKGPYDPNQSLAVNVALASPLLSRFDIVLVLIDGVNEAWDVKVSKFILGGHKEEQAGSVEGEGEPVGEGASAGVGVGVGAVSKKSAAPSKVWSLDKLRAYIALARSELEPMMSPQSDLVLRAYYQAQRSAVVRNAERTTIRMLESLIRLAQAHAKLMFRRVVDLQDAIVAIIMEEASMMSSALIPTGSALHSVFRANPDAEYEEHERIFLDKLGITRERLAEVSDAGMTVDRLIARDSAVDRSSTNIAQMQFAVSQYHPVIESDDDDDGLL